MPKISVIVPVYKVEEYLPFCVESILNQTFSDFELILVDDGSPDNCGKICDEYAEKDSRVRVIHRENGGLSAARNSGIDIAEGEYITFIDSDDAVTADYLEAMLWIAQDSSADVACCKMKSFAENTEVDLIGKEGDRESVAVSGREACISIYRLSSTVKANITAWGKLYRRECFSEIRFPVGRLNEDQFVVPIVLYEAGTVAITDAEYYQYRNRNESIMRTKFSIKRFDNIDGIDCCISYFDSAGDIELSDYAKNTRKKVLGILNILAEKEKIRENLPEQYRISVARALSYCYKYASNDTYTWYLSQLYPNGVVYHERFLRLKKFIGLKN